MTTGEAGTQPRGFRLLGGAFVRHGHTSHIDRPDIFDVKHDDGLDVLFRREFEFKLLPASARRQLLFEIRLVRIFRLPRTNRDGDTFRTAQPPGDPIDATVVVDPLRRVEVSCNCPSTILSTFTRSAGLALTGLSASLL